MVNKSKYMVLTERSKIFWGQKSFTVRQKAHLDFYSFS